MGEYFQQTLSGFRATKSYYTTREVAEIYHVSQSTVCGWMRKGWLEGEMREPVSKGAKTMRGRYRIFPKSIEELENSREMLIEQTRKYWVGILVKRKKA